MSSRETSEGEATLRVVHEAERERQHARYRIAADLKHESRTHRVENWSLDGVCVDGLGTGLGVGDELDAVLGFDFEGFAIHIDLKTRVIWQRTDVDRTGLQFVDLSERERSMLRYIIDAFLAGNIVTTGDLIHIVGRENFGKARTQPIDEEAAVSPGLRLVKTGLLTLVLIALVLFTVSTIDRRMNTIEARWASVEAPLIVIRAPQASYFNPNPLVVGSVLDEGDNVALVELVNGGAVAVDSPCRCSIVDIHYRNREFVAAGEPLVSLLPEGESIYVRASLEWDDVRVVGIGDRAEIRLGTREVFEGRVTKVETGTALAQRLSSPLKAEAVVDQGLASVLIRTERPLPPSQLDQAAWVTIDVGTAE